MNGSVNRSFLSPVLIGRASQVEYLRHLLASDSRPAALIVAGEAGIGKSRLVLEARKLAEAAGFSVLQGSCFDRDAAFPYSAVTDLIRGHLLDWPSAELEPVISQVGSELIKLVPELQARSATLVPTPPLDAEQERRRLFHALGQLFVLLAKERPLLVVLEDLHWADETTLDFLVQCCRQLAAAGRPHRIQILATYRTEDARPPLLHALAELDRLRLAEELRLDQLTRAETEVMVRAILDLHRPLRRDFLESLFNLTEGNPFFVEEILKSTSGTAGLEERDDADRQAFDAPVVPRSVTDAVTRRAAQLTAGARRLLEVAAVTGQRFDLRLLETVTASDAGALIEQVKELVAAQLVVEESAGRFRFRHALTRQAVYSGLLSTERSAYHRALAEALEAELGGQPEDSDGRIVDLAHHYYEAGVWDRAQQYSERAGLRADRLFAPAACVEHLTHAIDAARRIGKPLAAPILRVRAGAYELLGEFDRALADLEAALESARQAGTRDEEWEAVIAAGVLWASRDYDRTGVYFQDALKLAQEAGDRRRVAHSLNRVGNWQMNIGDPPGALLRHNEALAIFRELDDIEGMAATLDLLGMTSYHSVKLADEVSYNRKAIDLFRQLGNRQGVVSSLSLMAASCSSYDFPAMAANEAERAAAILAGEEALAEAQAIGWRAGESFACNTLAMAHGWSGNYNRAIELAHEGLRIAVEIQHEQWHVAMLRVLGELKLDLLNPEEARQDLEDGLALARKTGSDYWTECLSAGLTRALVALGEVEVAAELLKPFHEDRPLVMTAWLAGCAEVEVDLARRDYDGALRLVSILEAAAWPDGRPSRLTLHRVEALLGLQRMDEAAAAIDHVLSAGAFVPGPLRWRAQLLRGRILAAQGQRADAATAYRAARQTMEDVASGIDDAAVRSRFLTRAVKLLPQTRPETEARALAREQFDGLTEREREVAALVALGHTNREIGETLFLSERTVAVHVANTLAKLGFGSRAQIAAWATSRGIGPAENRSS